MSTPLAITGASALVHLKVPQTVGAFVRAKAQGTDFVKPDGAPDLARFGVWAGGFTALALIALAAERSPSMGEPMSALLVLIATTAVIAAWQDWIAILHVTPTASSATPAQTVGAGAAGAGSVVSGYVGGNQQTAWKSGLTVSGTPQSATVL